MDKNISKGKTIFMSDVEKMTGYTRSQVKLFIRVGLLTPYKFHLRGRYHFLENEVRDLADRVEKFRKIGNNTALDEVMQRVRSSQTEA